MKQITFVAISYKTLASNTFQSRIVVIQINSYSSCVQNFSVYSQERYDPILIIQQCHFSNLLEYTYIGTHCTSYNTLSCPNLNEDHHSMREGLMLFFHQNEFNTYIFLDLKKDMLLVRYTLTHLRAHTNLETNASDGMAFNENLQLLQRK